MEIKELVKDKLAQYLKREISQKDLYDFTVEILHKILKENNLNVKYLEIWGILVGLMEIEDFNTFCCDEQVYKYNQILAGEVMESFVYVMQIPKKMVKDKLTYISKILQKYMSGERLNEKEISQLTNFMEENNKVETVNDLLLLEVRNLLNLGYDIYEENCKMEFDMKHTLFVDEAASLEENLLNKIILLTEYYSGEKCFYVHVFFKNGHGFISIL